MDPQAAGPKIIQAEEEEIPYNGKSVLKAPREKVYQTQLEFQWVRVSAPDAAAAFRRWVNCAPSTAASPGWAGGLTQRLSLRQHQAPLHPQRLKRNPPHRLPPAML